MDDLGTEQKELCLLSEYASVTINVYNYSVHLGIWNVTAVFHFPFKHPRPLSSLRSRELVDRVSVRHGSLGFSQRNEHRKRSETCFRLYDRKHDKGEVSSPHLL